MKRGLFICLNLLDLEGGDKMTAYLLAQERDAKFQELVNYYKSSDCDPQKKKALIHKICTLDLLIESESEVGSNGP